MAVLIATDLHKSYARAGQTPTHVLRGVSLSVDRGAFIALMGPSGAGKSTLLHIMASLDTPDRGTVALHVDDRAQTYASMSAQAVARLRNRHLGMVFQFHHLLPEFSAIENVMMPRLIAGASSTEAHASAMRLLDRVGLRHRATHAPAEMSGGEQQRVAIARALVNGPTVLFADEPTGNLDSANAEGIIALLVDLQATEGLTCIVATHSQDLAARAHRVLHMKDGTITS